MNEKAHQSFTELDVWKKARELKNELFHLIKTFSTQEKFRLGDQITRSSRSINATISEDHGRYTFKDQLHYCIQARGSVTETHNHLIDAFDCNYISEEKLEYFKIKIDEVGRLLNGYISFLRKNLN